MEAPLEGVQRVTLGCDMQESRAGRKGKQRKIIKQKVTSPRVRQGTFMQKENHEIQNKIKEHHKTKEKHNQAHKGKLPHCGIPLTSRPLACSQRGGGREDSIFGGLVKTHRGKSTKCPLPQTSKKKKKKIVT